MLEYSSSPSLLSINSYHYNKGGADNLYLAHARLFSEKGWNTYFHSMRRDKNIPCDDSKFFSNAVDYNDLSGPISKIKKAIQTVYSLESRNNIARLLDEKHVDIAHIHNIYHHQSPSILPEIGKRGIPIVLTAHDLKLACPAYTMLNNGRICEKCKSGGIWNVATNKCIKENFSASFLVMIESYVHRFLGTYENYITKIITPSKFYKSKLEEWGWSKDKIVHIDNFVENKLSDADFILGDYIIYFGRLSAEKGLTTLIRSSARAEVPILIVGSGPQEQELRALALQLDAPVKFSGFQTGDALRHAIDHSRAVVLPSEWYENGPLSAIEGFFRGKPLIGADIGGISEMITDGETGWRFRSGDQESLVVALHAAMAASRDTIIAMRNAVFSMAKTRYSADLYYKNMLNLYETILPKGIVNGKD